MKRKKALIVLTIALAGCLALAGCGSKKESTSDDKTIIVGCEATTPGWAQKDDENKVTGYDHDVWEEIGRRTGYKIKFKVMDWDGMWTMLDDGRIDSVGEQISKTPEREKKYYLSEPYAYNRYAILSRADNTALNSLSDIKDGMTISCESNTSDELVVSAIEKEYGVTLKRTYYDGMSVKDVAMGRCDLWPRAYTSCLLTVKEVDNVKILGTTNILETNVYPFSKTKRGKMLNKKVSKAITEMREDGTLSKLSEKWFDMDISSKPEGAEELDEYTK